MAEDQIARSPADENSLAEDPETHNVLTNVASTDPPRDYKDLESVESDLVSGDEVIARGWPRNYKNLAAHGFRPIWDGTYPEDQIPQDIQEFLDKDGNCPGVTCIGPLSSFAWLSGLDEVIEHIDSPAYTIQDEIVIVPNGTEYHWPICALVHCGRIAPHIVDKLDGPYRPLPQYSVPWKENPQLPKDLPESPREFSLSAITGSSRLKRQSGKILCMRLESHKNTDKLDAKIRNLAGEHLRSGKIWYRGSTLATLKSTLAFFIPEANPENRRNEFGPGIYTSDSLRRSLKYIGYGSGALMVFKDPDLYLSNVWQLSLEEWSAWIIRWTSPEHTDNRPVPTTYLTADFIIGNMSNGETSRRNGSPITPGQTDDTQLVAVSYKGCQTLADSLYMIIFLE